MKDQFSSLRTGEGEEEEEKEEEGTPAAAAELAAHPSHEMSSEGSSELSLAQHGSEFPYC